MPWLRRVPECDLRMTGARFARWSVCRTGSSRSTSAIRFCSGEPQSRLLLARPGAQYAQRSERVPSAHLTRLRHLDEERSRYALLQRPPAVRLPLRNEQVNRVGDSWIVDRLRPAQMIKAAQHRVVPVPWVAELGEPLGDH